MSMRPRRLLRTEVLAGSRRYLLRRNGGMSGHCQREFGCPRILASGFSPSRWRDRIGRACGRSGLLRTEVLAGSRRLPSAPEMRMERHCNVSFGCPRILRVASARADGSAEDTKRPGAVLGPGSRIPLPRWNGLFQVDREREAGEEGSRPASRDHVGTAGQDSVTDLSFHCPAGVLVAQTHAALGVGDHGVVVEIARAALGGVGDGLAPPRTALRPSGSSVVQG